MRTSRRLAALSRVVFMKHSAVLRIFFLLPPSAVAAHSSRLVRSQPTFKKYLLAKISFLLVTFNQASQWGTGRRACAAGGVSEQCNEHVVLHIGMFVAGFQGCFGL